MPGEGSGKSCYVEFLIVNWKRVCGLRPRVPTLFDGFDGIMRG